MVSYIVTSHNYSIPFLPFTAVVLREVLIFRANVCSTFVTQRLKLMRFSKKSILRYGLKCKPIGSLVKLGFPQKKIHKHLIFHITNLQLRECFAKCVYLAVL